MIPFYTVLVGRPKINATTVYFQSGAVQTRELSRPMDDRQTKFENLRLSMAGPPKLPENFDDKRIYFDV